MRLASRLKIHFLKNQKEWPKKRPQPFVYQDHGSESFRHKAKPELKLLEKPQTQTHVSINSVPNKHKTILPKQTAVSVMVF